MAKSPEVQRALAEGKLKQLEAQEKRKEFLASQSEKQRAINQHGPKARQILGHLLRLSEAERQEVIKAANEIF